MVFFLRKVSSVKTCHWWLCLVNICFVILGLREEENTWQDTGKGRPSLHTTSDPLCISHFTFHISLNMASFENLGKWYRKQRLKNWHYFWYRNLTTVGFFKHIVKTTPLPFLQLILTVSTLNLSFAPRCFHITVKEPVWVFGLGSYDKTPFGWALPEGDRMASW